MIVFDLDGCLIDSRNLIWRSYLDAGVEPVGSFMTLGHHHWLGENGDEIHARKDAAYLRRLATDPLSPLPPWQAAELLHGAGEMVGLITGAPDGAIQVLAKRASSWPFTATCAGLSPAQKSIWLDGAGSGVYVDDQEYVTMPFAWRLVHYTGQDTHELVRQITGPPGHDFIMPHDVRYPDDVRGCPPNCPYRRWHECP